MQNSYSYGRNYFTWTGNKSPHSEMSLQCHFRNQTMGRIYVQEIRYSPKIFLIFGIVIYSTDLLFKTAIVYAKVCSSSENNI